MGLQRELEDFFQELHRHPELSRQEFQTTKRIREALAAIPGMTFFEMGLPTGCCGVLEGAGEGDTVALRADIDALPVEELTNLPYASCQPGVMHACGHDFHTTSVLGAARLLAERRQEWRGRVVFLFQPAEETGKGAEGVVASGLFEKKHIRRIYGLHVEPGLAVGAIGLKKGAFSASVDGFTIRVTGRGGHGAHPDQCHDPIPAALRLVQSLYEIRTRVLDPTHPAVLSITQVQAGTGYNIIPDSALVGGTVRSFRKEDRQLFQAEILKRADYLKQEGYQVETEWTACCPASDNDPALIDQIAGVIDRLGLPRVPYGMDFAGEDFADYQELVPGALIQIGVGETISPLHSPTFRVEPGLLARTASLLAEILLEDLAG